MVRLWLISITTVILLFLLLLGTAGWLLYTPQGTAWLLNRLSASDAVQIGRIEGTLGRELTLTDIDIQQPGLQFSSRQLHLQNHLQSVIPLRLTFDKVQLDHVRIVTSAKESPKSTGAFAWPATPWPLEFLTLSIKELHLQDLRWQEDNATRLQLDRFTAALHWEDGLLTAESLSVQTPAYDASGSLAFNFDTPRLDLDVRVSAKEETSSWQRLQLDSQLRKDEGELLLSGPVSLRVHTSDRELFNVAGRVGLAPKLLQFEQLRLQRPSRSGSLTASGDLRLTGEADELSGQLRLQEFDLQAETGQPVELSGTIQFQLNPEEYRGRFQLKNLADPPYSAQLSGDYHGNWQQVRLENLAGQWLNGTLTGSMTADWQDGWRLQTQLTGKGLDPQLLHPQLVGRFAFSAAAEFQGKENQPLQGTLDVDLRDATLFGQPLSGKLQLQTQGKELTVSTLNLQGEGLQMQAEGNPAERLQMSWRVERLDQLLPEISGSSAGEGWLRWQENRLSADLNFHGEQLAYAQWRLAKLDLQATTLDDPESWRLQLQGQQLQTLQPALQIGRINLSAAGSLADHRLSLQLAEGQHHLTSKLHGGWAEQQWRGEIEQLNLSVKDLGDWQLQQSAPLLVSGSSSRGGPLQLANGQGSELQLQAEYRPEQTLPSGQLHWSALDLRLLTPWLADWQISGTSDGTLELDDQQPETLQVNISAEGQLQNHQLRLDFSKIESALHWDDNGLEGRLQVELKEGARLQGTLSSMQPFTLGWPLQGTLDISGTALPLKTFQPWLPPDLSLTGLLNWQSSGRWNLGEPLSLKGEAQVKQGSVSWEEDEGLLHADLETATCRWQWQDQLHGDINLQLKQEGTIDAVFNLPLSAELPLQLKPEAPLQADLTARLQELGLLSLIFPGRIQESRGQLKLDLQLAGNRRQPRLRGNLHLFDAGAFLPTLGIQLDQVELRGGFDDDQLSLQQLQLSSGGGQLQGQGELTLRGWVPGAYQLELSGENLQLINLPELQVRATPDLHISGEGKEIRVRGQIKFPEVLINNREKTGLASNSPDLVVVDRQTPAEKSFRLHHDIDVKLILGERVLLNSSGIDAKLGGQLRLFSNPKQDLVANGEIYVEKGRYSSYGVSLDITRGHLYFTGGPLDQPTLDILALRKSGEVKAGVKVSGTPRAPKVELYSEPSMPETDVLAYIVLGHPLEADRSQSSLLITAAGALLSQGESVMLQEKLKNRLGLDVLDISAGDGDVESSIITTGKYLSPDLYVSFGYSLFNNANEMKVRYNLTPDWEIESSIGIESGIDMYYRIEIE